MGQDESNPTPDSKPDEAGSPTNQSIESNDAAATGPASADSNAPDDPNSQVAETLNGLQEGTASSPGPASSPNLDPEAVSNGSADGMAAGDSLAAGEQRTIPPANDGNRTHGHESPTLHHEGRGDGVPIEDYIVGLPQELANHPRYRPIALVGQGGMGSVYKASHRVMDRVVALKVIRPELSRGNLVERFRREIRAAAKLSHPNIVTAHDAEQAGDIYFLVVEFVEGFSLDKLVAEEGPLDLSRACDIVSQAAAGLQHAFDVGMVHRDIKPQNLMCTTQGQIKILDFGLALLFTDAAATSALTHEGGVMGTPDYIAPEQADDAHAADIRSDIYSLACTLYFLLRGEPPFSKGSVVQKIMAHMEKDVPKLNDYRKDIPIEIDAIIAKAMAKNPDQRYQTHAEFAAALAEFSSSTLTGHRSSTVLNDAAGPFSKRADSEKPPIVGTAGRPRPSTIEFIGDSASSSGSNSSDSISYPEPNDVLDVEVIGPNDSDSLVEAIILPAEPIPVAKRLDPSEISRESDSETSESSSKKMSPAEDDLGSDHDSRDSWFAKAMAGQISLLIGLSTIVVAWIPFVGVAVAPFSALGLLVSCVSIKRAWGDPTKPVSLHVIAAMICAVSLSLSVVAFYWTIYLAY